LIVQVPGNIGLALSMDAITALSSAVSLAEKVAFLILPAAYGQTDELVVARETHMSWVFLIGEEAYKLKKPIRLPYLDFSTLNKRHAACIAELTLNRRLASDTYKRVVPLTRSSAGSLSIGGPGEVVDWLVVMRRLDTAATLEEALLRDDLSMHDLDRLVATLDRFYRRARKIAISPAMLISLWHRSLAANRLVLAQPKLGLPAGLVRRIDRAQTRFLDRKSLLLASRVRRHRIVDGHGDLRPEHIWLGPPVRIIDGLEFNALLRVVDPLDEIAFLSLECSRLGGDRYGRHIVRRIAAGMSDHEDELFVFYRCYRATLRARLAIAHLIDRVSVSPAKWVRLTRTYLDHALTDALHLERLLD
jgi:aminoglycoside phosphotransferase family enzyme